ncbi:amino acid adenylation domain-containing protein [Saccharophagus degradans]|uniref:non-ribosomal peptide synthetase n=1 Tax=Saccharophagus degradans TaxID=86304 RepID=UPI002477F86A|nr:amino acid adenylation domain-containing protein [Saccharophagus degradans]WGO96540.1 amino acid adenylation domain-containing protein [Saccharophagus degradans]
MLSKENIADVYGLSPMQMGMLLHQIRHADTTAYIEQFDFVMEGVVNENALQQALTQLVGKYSALRSVFSYGKTDVPKQVVLKQREPLLDVINIEGESTACLQDAINAFKSQDKKRGFNLSKDMLVRMSLLKRPDDKSHVIFTFHHVILDGWCLGIVFKDLFTFYENALNASSMAPTDIALAAEPYPYANFIKWLDQQNTTAAENWWKAYLQDYSTATGLPWFDMPAKDSSAAPGFYTFNLGVETSNALAEIAKHNHLTFNALFQTAWGVLLQKFNNTEDVIFGTVCSGRPPNLDGVQEMVGLFINTLPLRVKADPTSTFIGLAANIGEQIFAASEFDYMPLYEIQQLTELKSKLINHVVAFENYPIADQMRQMSADAKTLSIIDVIVEEQTNYDFNVIVNPTDNVKVTFSYNKNKFSEKTMNLLQRSFTTLLQNVARNPNALVNTISICAPEDTDQVLNTFNATASPYPRGESIPALFSETAERYSDCIALSWAQGTQTYGELKEQVDRVAIHLQHNGLKAGDTVGIYLPRSPEVIVAILATLTLGASYVPLDIDTPLARTEFVLNDINASLILKNSNDLVQLPEHLKTLNIDELVGRKLENIDLEPVTVNPETTAYFMYTSGSTGQAKGCSISHRNIVRLVRNTQFADFEDQVILSTSSPVFDASTFEYWGALLNGGRLCLYDNGYLLDADKLKELIVNEQVSTMWLTAALFNQLVEADLSLFEPLQQLLIGGEVLSIHSTNRFIGAHPHIKLINGYGPTENTTFSTTFLIAQPSTYRIPIGKPISNSTCFILGCNDELLPEGAYGELCVGGDGVSNGYINREDLNSASYFLNPYGEGRLYRTGDIARWLPDGNIDLLGRKDFQHKIRGYRVELGEIEAAINSLPEVCDCVVQVKEGAAGKQIHAWYVIESGVQKEVNIKAALLQSLPRYMMPDHFMLLEKLPLTANGKVDRNALPDIASNTAKREDLALPTNEQEILIAGICKEVLGITELSIYDNFFELGANSINLITINNRLKKALDRDISIAVMFEHTSVHKLSAHLNPDLDAIEKEEKKEQAELGNARTNLMKTRKLKRMAEVL